MQNAGLIERVAVLSFIVFSCLRLARFNADIDSKINKSSNFFTGIPTPAGAGLILLPLIHSFLGFNWAYETPIIASIYFVTIGSLLVSKIPTFSGKQIRFQLKKFTDLKIIVCAFLFIICMINSPWITLSLVGLSYIISIPLSIRAWMNEKDLDKNSSDTLEI